MVDYKEKDEITIETLSGIKSLKAYTTNGEVTSLRVDMGKAILDPKEIPVAMNKDKIVNEPVTIGDKEYNITCVSMGNPHCVVFMVTLTILTLKRLVLCLKTINSSRRELIQNLLQFLTTIQSR